VTDNDNDKWVTVSEAAALLGCSERTVWRRVKAEELDIDRSVTPHLVRVSDVVSDRVVTETDNVSELSELRLQVASLEAEVERLREVLQEVRSERDYLRSAHAASLSTSQRLLEHVEGAEEVGEEREPETFVDWLRRVLGGGR